MALAWRPYTSKQPLGALAGRLLGAGTVLNL